MKPNSIALIGYRGTGKTTVARRLARLLRWDWVDADVEIELAAGKSIAAIFADEGEAAFRNLEVVIVEQLCRRHNTVLSLGGGAVLHDDNREAIARCDAVVWLKASPETMVRRMAEDSTTAGRRPNLTNADPRNEIDQLLALRTPKYRACATLEVDTEQKTPAEVANEIVAALGLAD